MAPLLTLIDILEHAAATDAAFHFADSASQPLERLSYADFARAAARATGGLAPLGAGRGTNTEGGGRIGQPIILVMPNGKELLTALFGALMAGLVPTIAAGPRPFTDPVAWAKGLATTATFAHQAPIVTTPAVARLFQQAAPQLAADGITPPQVFTTKMLEGPALGAVSVRPTDLALLQFTSGSLSDPRGAMLSHGGMAQNAVATAERLDTSPRDVGCFWIPLAHDLALITVLSLMAAGVDQIMMPTERFAIDPAAWLELVSGRVSYTVGPPFAFGLALSRLRKKGPPGALDFRQVRGFIVGAEPIDATALRKITAELAPAGLSPNAVMPSYGMAELTCSGCINVPGRPLPTLSVARGAVGEGSPFLPGRSVVRAIDGERQVELVGHGPAVPGHAVRVVRDVRDGGDVAPDGEVGHLQFRGPGRMIGYWRNPEATAEAFDGEWLRTGDLGFLQDGFCYVTGREKDVIIVRGRHFFPAEIEALALRLPGVRSGGALAFGAVDPGGGPERVWLLVSTTPDADQTALERSLRTTIADQHELALHEVVFVTIDQIPRTTSGKPRRAEARRRFADRAADAGP